MPNFGSILALFVMPVGKFAVPQLDYAVGSHALLSLISLALYDYFGSPKETDGIEYKILMA